MFTYKTEAHPTRKNAILMTEKRRDNDRTESELEHAVDAVGGSFSRTHSYGNVRAYNLSPAQFRDLEIILGAGFRASRWAEFWHPDFEMEDSYQVRDFTRAEALEEIAKTAPAARCKKTLKMDFGGDDDGEPEPQKEESLYRVEYSPVAGHYDVRAVTHYASAGEALRAAQALYRRQLVPRIRCGDFHLMPHHGRATFTRGELPRAWSFSSPADGCYKSLATSYAERAGVRYASHRRGYQASNRAISRFAASWDAFRLERGL